MVKLKDNGVIFAAINASRLGKELQYPGSYSNAVSFLSRI
jgi:hypothetical protein